ncbi:MAG TPA: tetratricopeptide repeat protein, partial [Geobacteraceae bacterium]
MHIPDGAAGGRGGFARTSVRCLLVVAAGILVYANTLHVPFVFDDFPSIVDNPVIKDLSTFLADGYRYNARRFVGYLTFALNYRFGGLDVTGFHFVNLAVHLATSLLVYAFALLTLRTPRLAGSRLVPRAGGVALGTALLFAVHPVETQAVTYIVQRFASLAAMLYLLSLILYAAARLGQVRAGRLWSPGTGLLLAGSLVAALLACRTKENAFTLPFALFLYEGMFFPLTHRKKAFLVTVAAACAAAAGGVVLWYGSSLGKLLSDVGGSLSAARDISRWHYLLTQFEVIATYVR